MQTRAATILIADDNVKMRGILSEILELKGFKILCCGDGIETLRLINEEPIDAVLLDIIMPRMNGLDILNKVTKTKPHLPVIMISGHATIRMAVDATKSGAYDFLEKPLDADRVSITLKNALEKRFLTQEVTALRQKSFDRYHMVGKSEAIQQVFSLIESAAPSLGKVLITGESGTGKELVAHAIHELSSRNMKLLVKINCAAVPDDLIESELFGHKRGAFTGAFEEKEGMFQRAHQSTLFMDEIADMSQRMQSKVLRAIELGEVQKVGGNEVEKVDVRLISATNKDLTKVIEEGKFRKDLFYRLNVVSIHIPPLRERREDIPLLANHFVSLCCLENNISTKELDTEAAQVLLEYTWPGNIRELRNVVEHLVIMSPTTTIDRNQVYQIIHCSPQQFPIPLTDSIKQARIEFERNLILKALNANNWNISKTSKQIGFDRTNLYRKMKRFGILKGEKVISQ